MQVKAGKTETTQGIRPISLPGVKTRYSTQLTSIVLLVVSTFWTQLATADVISFKDGFNGYQNTEETYISAASPNTSFAASGGIEVQGQSFLQGLLRFNEIVGTGPGQVSAGSTINSVTLSLSVYNSSTADFTVNRLLAPFIETDTYASVYGGDGASADDVEATTLGVTLNSLNAASLDVTELTKCWFDLSCANEGLAISDFTSNTDALGVYSSNDGLAQFRPELIVDFQPASVPGPATFLCLVTGLVLLASKRKNIPSNMA